MDKIDTLLLEAWNRIGEKLRRDRVAALKRSRRRFKCALTQPMREWCLVIRASDTRISDYRAIVEPALQSEFTTEITEDTEVVVNPVVSRTEFTRNPIENHQPHFVTLTGALIRDLCKPVKIPWPGVTYQQAADMLGRTKDSLYEWVSHGTFRVNRYPEFKYPRHGRRRGPQPASPHPERIARIMGEIGNGRPYVWTSSPIDPNNFHGRTPHAVWGTMWQDLWQELPEDYVLRVQRVPRRRNQPTRDGSNRRFLGWEWVCPGRLNADGELIGCGKRCTYLYAPQTVWTLGRALLDERDASGGIDITDVDADLPRLGGQWFPGLVDPVKEAASTGGFGGRSFACKECWGVRTTLMSSRNGWNQFITHISGGLLRGRDVPRPDDICPIVRKRRPYKQRSRAERKAVTVSEAADRDVAAIAPAGGA